MRFTSTYASPLGGITLASDGEALTGLWFDGQKYFARGLSDGSEQRELPIFERTKQWLDLYFSGRTPDFTPPLRFDGESPFRKRVWQILLTIPYGSTTTYGRIARETGKNVSAQAVGGAVGHNPVSIIIPCHRVVGANGSLTGYAGGVDKKIRLLQLEGVDTEKLFVPSKGARR